LVDDDGLLITLAGVIVFEFGFEFGLKNSKSIPFVPKHLEEETLWKIVTNSVATEVISVDKVTGSKAIILYYIFLEILILRIWLFFISPKTVTSHSIHTSNLLVL